MRRLIICIVSLFIGVNLFAGDTGSASMTFLNIAPNPRVAALGESFTAQVDDASSVYWNPAGLNTLNNMEAIANYNIYFESISFFNIMFAKNFSFGGLGINITALSFGSIDNYIDGTLSGSISPNDFLVSVAYSRKIMYNLFIGGAFKYISESLTTDYSGTGIGFDMGILYKNPLGIFIKRSFIKPLKFGFVVQNIGIGPKYDVDNNSLPFNIKFGFAYKLRLTHSVAKLKDINFMLDFLIPKDSSFGIRYGTEFWWYNLGGMIDAAFRIGLKMPQDLGFVTGLTFGAGVRIFGVEIDYAFVNYGDLGLTHRLGLDYKFGTILKPKESASPSEERKATTGKAKNKKEEKIKKSGDNSDQLDEQDLNDTDVIEEDLDLEE